MYSPKNDFSIRYIFDYSSCLADEERVCLQIIMRWDSQIGYSFICDCVNERVVSAVFLSSNCN